MTLGMGIAMRDNTLNPNQMQVRTLLVKSTMDITFGVIVLTILKTEIIDRKGKVEVMRLEAEVVTLKVDHRIEVMMEAEEEDINQDKRTMIAFTIRMTMLIKATVTIKRVEADTVRTMTACRVRIMPIQPAWLPKAI